jgi:long-chain acyl-CoA synthetase
MRSSINSYLADYLRRGEEPAFAYRRGLRVVRWSYERIARTAFKFARELESRRIERGERVLLWAKNRPEWVAAFFGCTLRGVIVVPLDVESTLEFASKVLRQTQARLLLTDAENRPSLGIPTILLDELTDALAQHSDEPLSTDASADTDLVEIIYTSGTTAEPRGVCITHRNLLANLVPLEDEIEKYLRWERLVHPVRFLNLLPLSHVFGQFMGILVPQLLGGEVVFQESLNPSEVVSSIRKQRINVVVTVPRLLDSLREHIERWNNEAGGKAFEEALAAAVNWGPLRRWWRFRKVHRYFGVRFWAFITGGASLSEQSENFWRLLGFAVLQGYGMTETASLISVNHPFKPGRGSVGKTLPGQEVRLDENGEILVRGANVTPGYWKGEIQHLESDDGWLRTGDMGEIDSAGNIYFKGRQKDVIVTAAGLNIYPEDIEAALNRQPEIRQSAVIGVDGPRGPEPLAVIIPKSSKADTRMAVDRANAALARHQHVLRWVVWPENDFPRTTTQKVKKREILERLEARKNQGLGLTSNGSSNSTAADLVLDAAIVRTIKSGSGASAETLKRSSNLESDLKLDSLGRVELLSAIEDRYQIEIDEAAFTAATTLGDVERIVRSGGAGAEDTSRYPYPYWTQKFPVTWFRLLFYYTVILPITCILCWVRVRDAEHLRELKGPVLFVSNHITYFDHALIMSALPGRYRRSLAIAQEGERLRWWRRPPVGTPLVTRVRWLLQYVLVVSVFNTFSLPQKSGFRRSFTYAGESVDRGYSLLVFPEGTRTEDGLMATFRSGIGILASKLDIPVVPVRIDGLSELKLAGRRGFTAPGNVTVRFGQPVRYESSDDAAFIASDLERRVRELDGD